MAPHGELFPLPCALADRLPWRSSVARWLSQRLRAKHCLQRWIRSSCCALNWCSDPRWCHFRLDGEWLLPEFRGHDEYVPEHVSRLQASVLESMSRRARSFGRLRRKPYGSCCTFRIWNQKFNLTRSGLSVKVTLEPTPDSRFFGLDGPARRRKAIALHLLKWRRHLLMSRPFVGRRKKSLD